MPLKTTTSLLLLYSLTVVLMTASTRTRAAPPCDAINYQCWDAAKPVMVLDADNHINSNICRCCPTNAISSACEWAWPRCTYGLYTCSRPRHMLHHLDDGCMCCPDDAPCYAAELMCPNVKDPACFQCSQQKCSGCVPGYAMDNSGLCRPA